MVQSRYKYSYSLYDYLLMLGAGAFMVSVIMLTQGTAYASSSNLLDLFNTQTFRGSTEALTGANWIGMFLHYVISWFSFIGLCLVIYQKFNTFLYLSSRNLWDTVYELKTEKVKGSFFGYKDFAKGIFDTSASPAGGGVDTLVMFFYGLLPNIKYYSDFAPNKTQGQGRLALKDDDDITAYTLKTAIPTIMTIFILTIGFSGTLVNMYGTVVDGLATGADKFVTTNLSYYVEKLVGQAGGYDFTLGASGTQAGSYGESVAKGMYNKIASEVNSNDTEFQQALGRAIEEAVAGVGVKGYGASTSILDGGNDESARANLLKLANASLAASSQLTSGTLSESEVKALKSPRVYTNYSASTPGDYAVTWSVAELLAATGYSITSPVTEKYIHVVTEIGYSNSTNYLAQLEDATVTNSSTSYIDPSN